MRGIKEKKELPPASYLVFPKLTKNNFLFIQAK